MSRRGFLNSAALLTSASTIPALAGARAARAPNIVLIVADDLGIGDLGCYGQKLIRTPNIDRLAAEGLRFTDAYSGCTVCAPSRSVLMTGYHMGHSSVRNNTGGQSLRENDVTLPMLLKQAGYATGGYGKWGLGDRDTPGAPSRKGFDEFFGYLNQAHAHNYYTPVLVHNDDLHPLPANAGGKRGTYSQDVISGKALAFIERNARQPFFCYLPSTIPHWELLVPEDSFAEYRGKFPERGFSMPASRYADQPEMRAAYAAMVTRLDREVGRIVDLVRRIGQERNTLFVFTSDNGNALGILGENYFNSSAGFRGHKQNLYEGGIRTPMIARWPGRVPGGATSSLQWSFCDMLPTLADIAGLAPPKGIDGISMAPTLLGRRQRRAPEWLYWELPRWIAKESRFSGEIPMQAARNGGWKVVRPQPGAPLELYDLRTDPRESKDLAASEPKILARMEAFLKSARTPARSLNVPPTFYWDRFKAQGPP
ncbi:MAG: arylsulfatase [Candidatus Solibacter usitatus]|nr:arylsulfatase [Candidatus Solibacter usitatus]